jgi:hypothetical protein
MEARLASSSTLHRLWTARHPGQLAANYSIDQWSTPENVIERTTAGSSGRARRARRSPAGGPCSGSAHAAMHRDVASVVAWRRASIVQLSIFSLRDFEAASHELSETSFHSFRGFSPSEHIKTSAFGEEPRVKCHFTRHCLNTIKAEISVCISKLHFQNADAAPRGTDKCCCSFNAQQLEDVFFAQLER